MLVTIEQAKDHLRIDSEADDTWLAGWIPAISQAVLLWLKDETRAYDDEEMVKPIVQSAVLIELASQYRFREGDGAAQVPANWGHGYTLSLGATALLTPLRKSTVA